MFSEDLTSFSWLSRQLLSLQKYCIFSRNLRKKKYSYIAFSNNHWNSHCHLNLHHKKNRLHVLNKTPKIQPRSKPSPDRKSPFNYRSPVRTCPPSRYPSSPPPDDGDCLRWRHNFGVAVSRAASDCDWGVWRCAPGPWPSDTLSNCSGTPPDPPDREAGASDRSGWAADPCPRSERWLGARAVAGWVVGSMRRSCRSPPSSSRSSPRGRCYRPDLWAVRRLLVICDAFLEHV